MVDDDALNALLDELERAGDREALRAVLRHWLAELKRTWDAASIEKEYETLGKLGGGGR